MMSTFFTNQRKILFVCFFIRNAVFLSTIHAFAPQSTTSSGTKAETTPKLTARLQHHESSPIILCSQLSRTTTTTTDQLSEDPDYLVTDSYDLLPSERPSLLEAMSNPRDILATILSIVGTIISCLNILGQYDDSGTTSTITTTSFLHYQQYQQLAIGLGFVSSIASILQIVTNYKISYNIRRGIVDDAAVNLYAALYTLAVSWLALRTSSFCPSFFYQMDTICAFGSITVFLYSFFSPLITLLASSDNDDKSHNWIGQLSYQLCQWITQTARLATRKTTTTATLPPLSETELLRARGLLAIGILGCVFTPDALSFLLGGQEWWSRVAAVHPSQQTLESSTSLFALFATEASMISHRVGKLGVATYQNIVPAFAVVCFVLAVLPCVSAIYWLGSDVSFFSFYRE
jgi:hypothetical protein